jgi:iron complex outermembrane receptor protein
MPLALAAQQAPVEDTADDDNIEVVVVTGVRLPGVMALDSSEVTQPGVDTGDLLRLFPGGNRNSNGPLTRISQYRGLFGAQNNVSVDGQTFTAGCPNWMATPLSSLPRSMSQSLTLHRGLGSVALIEEGLGGAIEVTSRKKGFGESGGWSTFGRIEGAYGSNASDTGITLYTGLHDADNWLDAAASFERGDDYEFDGGTVAATEYDRNHYRFGYGRRAGEVEFSIGAVINRTGESGTPALPMDIVYFDSDQYDFSLDASLAGGELRIKAHTVDVEHVMDNFTLRLPPLTPMGKEKRRSALATADGGGYKLSFARAATGGEWLLGIDGKQETHDADVTNPVNAVFYLTNFNRVERDRIGAFAQFTRQMDGWIFEAGVRYNRLAMDAGEVGGNLALPPGHVQQDRLDMLADAFNAADREKTDHQWSAIIKTSSRLGENSQLNLGIGRKVRSPSYQERYLWAPMESTSGLADGYTYIGDIDLEPEVGTELTAGIDWSDGGLRLTPELFYRDVSDYILGVPSTNQAANQFAMVTSGRPPLQFANVDAELYGADLGFSYEFSTGWSLRGNLAYVRGKRTDVKDNLYRIPPLSSLMELQYSSQRWFVTVEGQAASRQDKVSAYNAEKETPGWGIVTLRGGFSLGEVFDVNLGIENAFDKAYQDHLGGYNRVRGSDVPTLERLYSKGRNYYISLNASW